MGRIRHRRPPARGRLARTQDVASDPGRRQDRGLYHKARGKRRKRIPDLDSLPWVSRVYQSHLRIEDYFYSITRHPVITIITGRGCPFRCVFCLYPQVMHGHEYRTRSPESVAAEFEYIVKELYAIKAVVNFEKVKFMSSAVLGKLLAQKAVERGVKRVCFDRGGYAYHGRVRALAEAARKEGLEF